MTLEDATAPQMPTGAELRAFLAVAEERHFTRAAAYLGIAVPSLSRSIRRLESRLGSVLFERTPRSVVLTPSGETLLPLARDILERLRHAQAAVSETTRGRAGRFTIGVFSNGFAELTGPIVSTFRRAHPDVVLGIRDMTENPLQMLLGGAVDVALVRPPLSRPNDERIELIHLVAEPRCALLPKGHDLADAHELVIHDILDLPFVSAIPQCPYVANHWAATDWRGGEPARVGFIARTVPDVLRGVGFLGNVVTAMPSLLRFIRVSGIAQVPLADMPPTTMAVAFRTGSGADPLIRDLTCTAREVSERMAHLIPGAWFIKDNQSASERVLA